MTVAESLKNKPQRFKVHYNYEFLKPIAQAKLKLKLNLGVKNMVSKIKVPD